MMTAYKDMDPESQRRYLNAASRQTAFIEGRAIRVPPPQHGRCLWCDESLDGGGIWLHFFWKNYLEHDDLVAAKKKADETAHFYGADRARGRWGLQVALIQNDRVQAYGCPHCKRVWDSQTGELIEGEECPVT